jgi:membrane protease YdiL (CAAX protease family)
VTAASAQAPGAGREGAYRIGALAAAAAIVAIEALLVAPGHLLAAQILDAALVFALVNIGPHGELPRSARALPGLAALRALALVPLIRVVSIGLPSRDWNEPVAVLAIALPIGFVALALAPTVGVRRRALIAWRVRLAGVYAIFAGIVLGLLAFLAGAPAMWPDGATDSRAALGVAAGTIAAIVEEIVFRGLLQTTLQRAFGRAGVLLAAAVFAATYLDIGSTALVLTIALAGVVFAHAAASAGNITGAVIGHVLLVVGAGAIWPQILDSAGLPDLHEPQTSIALAVAIAIAIGLALSHPVNASTGKQGE